MHSSIQAQRVRTKNEAMPAKFLSAPPIAPRRARAIIVAIASCLAVFILAATAGAQGSRHDDIVFGTTGHPVAGATITVCQATATGTPCSPLATIYTNATLGTASPNPFQSDGLGNFHFYAPAGRYLLQFTGTGITGTVTQPDVILAPDVTSTGSGNNISAFGLNLGGNLAVAGNATISGTLTTATFSPSTFAPSSLQVTGNGCFGGPRPYIDVTCPPYGAHGDGSTDDTTAITNAINAACATTIGGASTIPDVVFPAGRYLVDQTQRILHHARSSILRGTAHSRPGQRRVDDLRHSRAGLYRRRARGQSKRRARIRLAQSGQPQHDVSRHRHRRLQPGRLGQ